MDRRATIAVAEAAMAAHVDGEPSAPCIVLLHGHGGSSEDWRATVGPFVAAGLRVVRLDLPGHGAAAAPEEEAAYSLEILAEAVALEVGRIAPGPVVLVGHSMSGGIAQELVRLGSGRVAALVLVDSIGGHATPDPSGTREARAREESAIVADGGMEALWDHLVTTGGMPWLEELDAEARDQERRSFSALSPRGYIFGAAATRARRDCMPALAAAGGPTLVIRGEGDSPALCAMADQLALAARTVPLVIAGAGHSPHVDRPAEFVDAVLAFLAGVPALVSAGLNSRSPTPSDSR